MDKVANKSKRLGNQSSLLHISYFNTFNSKTELKASSERNSYSGCRSVVPGAYLLGNFPLPNPLDRWKTHYVGLLAFERGKGSRLMLMGVFCEKFENRTSISRGYRLYLSLNDIKTNSLIYSSKFLKYR